MRRNIGLGFNAFEPVCFDPGSAVGAEFLSWKRRFDDAIVLPDGRKLITLEDAGNHITELPEAVHEAEEWQAAMEALILALQLPFVEMGAPSDRLVCSTPM
jgi:hypothetical protein